MEENFDDLNIQNEGIILEKTKQSFEEYGVLNPACIFKDGLMHMFYRAVAKNNFSTIGFCKFKDGKIIERNSEPILIPEFEYEKHGIEDPRISLVDGIYYLFYTAYDGKNAQVAYATSIDLITFEKCGIISPQIEYKEAVQIFKDIHMPVKYIWYGEYLMKTISEDLFIWQKDAFLFPKKIKGKFAMMNRVLPGIQIVYFDNFEQLKQKDFWINQLRNIKENIVLEPKYWFESKLIGGGCIPLETKDGWLLIYHGVEEDPKTYRAGAALLDLQDPTKVIGRLSEPLFSPMEKWEKVGIVGDVVFPSSALDLNNRLHIYYGAADEFIGAKSLDIKILIRKIKQIGNK
jgi:predicted GH43/DUF377 family glycosyl hydrolase